MRPRFRFVHGAALLQCRATDPEGEIGECQVPETHAIPLLLEAAAGESKSFAIFGDNYPTADGTPVYATTSM
jgi:UDP-glucose 4-epimerase